ncbi:hypothetical protein [Bradyrhizobium sp. 21]|uniref:hypothetical protein n=1 Tax=Bradyrhizobium sp. 21 TaxID=2782666 RepID=UPI001FFA6EA4|nr:hypothetical protein [Bradyrhizobium sp. 21]MCK1388981.1 hypothetical protein [Bradyrhizobium sp. 21]
MQDLAKRENRVDIEAEMAILARIDRLSAHSSSDIPRPTGQLPDAPDSIHFAFRTIGSHGPLELPHSLGVNLLGMSPWAEILGHVIAGRCDGLRDG